MGDSPLTRVRTRLDCVWTELTDATESSYFGGGPAVWPRGTAVHALVEGEDARRVARSFSRLSVAAKNDLHAVTFNACTDLTTDAFVRLGRALPHMTVLRVSQSPVLDWAWVGAPELAHLKDLKVPVPDAVASSALARHIGALTRLRRLVLLGRQRAPWSIDLFDAIARLPSLRELRLWRARFDTDMVEALMTARGPLEITIDIDPSSVAAFAAASCRRGGVSRIHFLARDLDANDLAALKAISWTRVTVSS